MDWKKEKLQSLWKMNKERLIFLFCSGVLLVLLAIPNEGPGEKAGTAAGQTAALTGNSGNQPGVYGETAGSQGNLVMGADNQPGFYGSGAGGGEEDQPVSQNSASGQQVLDNPVSGNQAVAQSAGSKYEEQLEDRIREILSGVEGVGEVEVMVVLKSSEEQIFHVDQNSSTSVTENTGDGSSGQVVRQQELSESTVLEGQSSQPVVEKEMMPEISGIIISADGGGSSVVKAEISGAMEALFGLPSHKIKVLKRVNKGA